MGTHPIFESDFDCLTDLWTEYRLPLRNLPPGQHCPAWRLRFLSRLLSRNGTRRIYTNFIPPRIVREPNPTSNNAPTELDAVNPFPTNNIKTTISKLFKVAHCRAVRATARSS